MRFIDIILCFYLSVYITEIDSNKLKHAML